MTRLELTEDGLLIIKQPKGDILFKYPGDPKEGYRDMSDAQEFVSKVNKALEGIEAIRQWAELHLMVPAHHRVPESTRPYELLLEKLNEMGC